MLRLPAIVLLFIGGVAVADDAAARKLLKDLEGTYTPTAVTRAGEVAPPEQVKAISAVIIKGDTITLRFAQDKKIKDNAATLVVDPAQKPIAIDMTPKEGDFAGKPVLGILKIDKDMITVCWADRRDAADRPKDFSSTKENKNLLIVMKKAR